MASRLLLIALAASASLVDAQEPTRVSVDLEVRQVPTQTITDVDTTVGANVLGTTVAATSGSVLSWSAVSASIFAPSASLATSTAPPVSPKPTPSLNLKAPAAAVAAACAPRYSAKTTLSGAVGTLPRPSTFVTRKGVQLLLNGKVFRPVGPNIYWLGLDENVQPNPSYPDQGRVREVVAMAAAMGANTIRCGTCGISVGNALSVWPTINGATNQAAFAAIDYAIATARNYGLRLIIPLTDNYNYYHGGKYTFLAAFGYNIKQSGVGQNFYTDTRVIQAYKNYISVILNHVNTLTGVAYKNDPTIMAWETGNELGAYRLSEGAPPAAWTNQIAIFIKQLAPKHLVVDGSDGLVNTQGAPIPGLGVAAVDIVTDHLYPISNSLFNSDNSLAHQAKKAFVIGEYDWTGLNGGDSVSSFVSTVEKTSYSSDMLWSMFGHDAQCCNFVTHNDGYSLYYPGNSQGLQANVLAISRHWRKLSGQQVLNYLPAVACPQPAFTP